MLSIRAHRRVYCVAAPLVRLKEKKLLWKQNDLETECRRQRKITARWVNMTLKDFDELIQKVKRLKRLNFSEFRRSYFIQSNSLIKSTLMFNVLPGTEIIVHAEFSHCRQNWYYGLQAIYSSMALKSGGGHAHCHTARKWGSLPLCLVCGCRYFVAVIQVLNSNIVTLCQFCIPEFMV